MQPDGQSPQPAWTTTRYPSVVGDAVHQQHWPIASGSLALNPRKSWFAPMTSAAASSAEVGASPDAGAPADAEPADAEGAAEDDAPGWLGAVEALAAHAATRSTR